MSASIKPTNAKPATPQDGIALVICLGLLAVMTLLAVAFSIAMRVEHMAARNFADGVRAKLLVHTALVRAMADIDAQMVTPPARVYPAWDIANSAGASPTNIMTPEALKLIPAGALLSGGTLRSQAAAASAGWISVANGRGRVAYTIVNTSGLIDANAAGGPPYTDGVPDREWSTNFTDIDISGAPEFQGGTAEDFANERAENVRYEGIDELAALSTYIGPDVQTFQTFSYDPGRDQVFLTMPAEDADRLASGWWTKIDTNRPPRQLGKRDAVKYLHDKFNINSITNFACWNKKSDPNKYLSDTLFMANYFAPLTSMLKIGLPNIKALREVDVAWNIVNYLDEDRFPHGTDGLLPYTKSEGGEAIPLVNELCISRDGVGYRMSAEIWYPFAPVDVTADDKFGVELWIYTKFPPVVAAADITKPIYVDSQYCEKKFLSSMVFPDSAFEVIYNTKPIAFPADGNLGDINPDGTTNQFWFLVRVTKEDENGVVQIVDEAMGYNPAEQRYGKRRLYLVNEERDYSINDPRSNGQVKYWRTDRGGETCNINGRDYPASEATLGAINKNQSMALIAGVREGPWQESPNPQYRYGGGLPIYAKNGPMKNMGELGHIWQSNLDDEVGPSDPLASFWRNIQLMRGDQGAMLLDMLAVHNASPPMRGVFCSNSRQRNAWESFLYHLKIGDTHTAPFRKDAQIDGVLNELMPMLETRSCISFTDFFPLTSAGEQLSDAFRNAGDFDLSGDPYRSDLYFDGAFRGICELMSFRQNIFTILLAAQALTPDPDGAGPLVGKPIADRRAIATVYRDSYTGRRFIRNFKWLGE